MRQGLTCLAAIAVVIGGVCVLPAAASADQGTLYNLYEKTFHCTNAASLTNAQKSSQAFTATFTGPNGSPVLSLPGFWAGGDRWKFRFAPTATGTWTWRVSAPDRGFSEPTDGSLSVGPSSNKGFLKVDSSRPYCYSYSDGTPIYPWGMEGWAILETVLHDGADTSRWRRFIDQTREHGMDKIRLVLLLPDWGGTYWKTRYFAWDPCTVAHPQFTAFNTPYWDKMDQIVQYMQSQGIFADIILLTPYYGSNIAYDEFDPKSPGLFHMTEADEQLLMRYAVARYAGYSNVTWCLSNEWCYSDRARYGAPKQGAGNIPADWMTGMGNYMRRVDPYVDQTGRLLSTHNGTRRDFAFKTGSWPTDFCIQYGIRNGEGYTKGHDWGNAGILSNWGHNKPVRNDEYGYDGAPGINRELVRKTAWAIAVAGGYGSYHEQIEEQANRPGNQMGLWYDHPSQDDIRVLVDFMRGVDYRNMAQQNALVAKKPAGSSAYMYASPGSQYVMYAAVDQGAAGGGDFTIRLKAGTYRGDWYSPTTGKRIQAVAPFVQTADAARKLTAPSFTDDVVLWIKKVK